VTVPAGTLVAAVDAIPLAAPPRAGADLDTSSHTVVVRVWDESGRTGIGEADAPPTVVSELVVMDDLFDWSRGLRGVLLGRDPFELAALHADLAAATAYHGRRGLGVHALSAVDVALHDLVAKQLGRPVYQLLGGAARREIRPYATLWPGGARGRTIRELMDEILAQLERALALGFRAVKMEAIFGDLVSDRELVRCVGEVRRLLGDEATFIVDFGYRWHDWRDALWTLNRLEEHDLFFAEATLQHDDLAGHAKLARRSETRIAGGEMAATIHEFREWLERGQVDVLQPDVGRSGGLTELRRIAEMAALAGATVVPHAWKTGITAAATRHFQAATANVPFVETLVPELWPSPLRVELTTPEPVVADGVIPLPTEPGLGIELVAETVERYRVDR
jgi:L-alanine-DL-glutamate epimerase-like enolase superfamily enzyme